MPLKTPECVYSVTRQNLVQYRIQTFEAHPNLTHAIFTRQGGVSEAPYHSLNLSISSGDDPTAVEKNLQLACQTLNITPQQTVACQLVHGAEIIAVTKTNRQVSMGLADGLITATPGVYLFMRFADCTPLLFYDSVKAAVGLTHAGWRGTIKNVAGATVTAMEQRLGCRSEHITAVVGPAIGPCCYEVGPEVITAAEKKLEDPTKLLVRRNGSNSRAYFDLWEANRRQLMAAGIKRIIQTKFCTACHTNTFFSHRAEKGRTGRFGVLIGLKENQA